MYACSWVGGKPRNVLPDGFCPFGRERKAQNGENFHKYVNMFHYIYDRNIQKEHLWLLMYGQRWTTHMSWFKFPLVSGMFLSRQSAFSDMRCARENFANKRNQRTGRVDTILSNPWRFHLFPFWGHQMEINSLDLKEGWTKPCRKMSTVTEKNRCKNGFSNVWKQHSFMVKNNWVACTFMHYDSFFLESITKISTTSTIWAPKVMVF